MNYEAGLYFNPDIGRSQWAVFCTQTHVWYFATRYGKAAAGKLAEKMNREIS